MFSNQSVSVHPAAPPIETQGTPKALTVAAVSSISSQLSGGCTPAWSKTLTLYHQVDLLETLKKSAYGVPSTEPMSFHAAAKLSSSTWTTSSLRGWMLPSSASCVMRAGWAIKATSGGLPPSIWVPRKAAISSPADRKEASMPVSSVNASSTARKFFCSVPVWTEDTSIGAPPSSASPPPASPSSSPPHAAANTAKTAIRTTHNRRFICVPLSAATCGPRSSGSASYLLLVVDPEARL